MEMAGKIIGQLAIWRIDSENFIQAWTVTLECGSFVLKRKDRTVVKDDHAFV